MNVWGLSWLNSWLGWAELTGDIPGHAFASDAPLATAASSDGLAAFAILADRAAATVTLATRSDISMDDSAAATATVRDRNEQ